MILFLTITEGKEEFKNSREQENYTFAGQLSDQGYGTFDQCLAVLTACDGDTEQARKALLKAHQQR